MNAITFALSLQEYVNVPKAAELLGITGTAVRSLAARGHLTGSVPPHVSPSGQWLIPLAAVQSRQQKKRRNALPVGGFHAHKARDGRDLRRHKKTSKKSAE